VFGIVVQWILKMVLTAAIRSECFEAKQVHYYSTIKSELLLSCFKVFLGIFFEFYGPRISFFMTVFLCVFLNFVKP